jgi:hypothetical protein
MSPLDEWAIEISSRAAFDLENFRESGELLPDDSRGEVPGYRDAMCLAWS